MIAFESDTWLSLGFGILPIVVSIILFVQDKNKLAIYSLVIGALFLRLAIISLDPIHEWDERFHALVAKNMMVYPFKPMLHVNALLDYDYKAWCCNHIWVHKQPLFLWQMALSMKIFGVNEIALRLPSAIMGTISVYFIQSIVNFWTKNEKIAFIAAFLFSLSFFQLEMTSGKIGLDHNDIGFSFYVTASIWAFCLYVKKKTIFRALLIGVFVGLAVLIKWLPGILVFGAWGLYVLLHKNTQKNIKAYLPIVYSSLISVLIFLPWQLYIMYRFPKESAWEYEFNRKHIFEALEGHAGSVFYHLNNIETIYGLSIILFIVGLYFIYKKYQSKLTFVFIAMILVLYIFFSIVATKMPAFVYPVSSLMLGIFAIGIFYTLEKILSFFKNIIHQKILMGLFLFIIGFVVLNPINIANYRSVSNTQRNHKINNIEIFKALNVEADIVLNCKSFENIELMFYNNLNAYHWYPSEIVINDLLEKGYKIAAFKSHGNQILPAYILNNKEIEILDFEMK